MILVTARLTWTLDRHDLGKASRQITVRTRNLCLLHRNHSMIEVAVSRASSNIPAMRVWVLLPIVIPRNTTLAALSTCIRRKVGVMSVR